MSVRISMQKPLSRVLFVKHAYSSVLSIDSWWPHKFSLVEVSGKCWPGIGFCRPLRRGRVYTGSHAQAVAARN